MRLTEDFQLRRRRLAVLLRPLLAVPAVLVALIWGVIGFAAFLPACVAALALGRVPAPLHRAIAAALEYDTQLTAWASLLSATYPWPRRRRTHPVQLEAPRERQRRWTVALRVLLAVPALVLGTAFGVVLSGTAIAAWFVALALGRTTEGLRELGAFCLRYATQTTAYLLLLTPQYPTLAPPVDDQPLAEPHVAQ